MRCYAYLAREESDLGAEVLDDAQVLELRVGLEDLRVEGFGIRFRV